MLFDKIIPVKYTVKNTVCGLEVLVTDEGLKFFYTIIQNKNNKLIIIESGNCEQQLALPSKVVKDKIPVIITVTGKGLISKKIDMADSKTDYEELLIQNLPSIDKKDFYIQLYPQRECDSFISILRKDKVNAILDLLKLTKCEIADVFLGYPFVSDVIPFTNLFEKIVTNNAIIEINNSCIETIKIGNPESNPVIEIDDLAFNKTNILSFGLCFVYLLNSKRHYNYDGFPEFRNKHLEKNKLRVMTRATIVVAFVLCLINYLCFNYYFTQNKKLETELNLYEGKYQQINELLHSYEEKKNLIEEAGILNDEGFTNNIDRIASSIPKELILTDWNINPIIQNTDEDSLIKFKKNNLIIKGNCDKSLLVNEWIHVLKSQNFIKDVNLENFAFRNEGYQPNFELKIVTE